MGAHKLRPRQMKISWLRPRQMEIRWLSRRFVELTRTAVTAVDRNNAWNFSLKLGGHLNHKIFGIPYLVGQVRLNVYFMVLWPRKLLFFFKKRLLLFLIPKKHLLINSQVSQIQVIKEQTRGCLGCVEADYILLGWTGVVSGREPVGGSHPTISHDGRVSIHQPPWVFQDTDEYKQNAWERLRKRKGPAACHMFFFQRKFSVGGKKNGTDIFSG